MTVGLDLLAIHFVADWFLQSWLFGGWMALNKSHSWTALLAHTMLYSACFLPYGLAFVGITFVLHTLVDAVTSKLTARAWFFSHDALDGCDPPLTYEWRYIHGRRKWFFTLIGLDQLIHFGCLAWTVSLLK